MLSKQNDIDQLFKQNLERFEKTPPGSAWEGIEKRLNYRTWFLTGLKTVSIAATIVLACFAGWRMNNSAAHPDIQVEQTALQTDKSEFRKENLNMTHPAVSKTSSALVNPPKEIKIQTSKMSLPGAIAANSPDVAVNRQASNPRSGGQVGTVPDHELPANSLNERSDTGKAAPESTVPENNNHPAIAVTDTKSIHSNTYKGIGPDKSAEVSLVPQILRVNKRWSLRAEYAPALNNLPQNNDQLTEINYMGAQNTENQKITSENTFSAGVLAGYRVSRRISLRSGVVCKNIRQTVQNSEESSSKRRFQYIEVPVHAACKLADQKIGVSLTGGFGAAFLIGNSELLSVNNEPISKGKTANMQSVNCSALVGMEFGYDITKRITITVEPRLRHDLNSLSALNSVNYKADHLEIATGLTYCFD